MKVGPAPGTRSPWDSHVLPCFGPQHQGPLPLVWWSTSSFVVGLASVWACRTLMVAGCPHSQEIQATAASPCRRALSCDFPFQETNKQTKTLKNALGRLSYCSCKVLVRHWQPRLGLNLPGVWGCSPASLTCSCLLCIDCPQDPWWIFTLGFSGEKFVIHHHSPHPSPLQSEWLEGKGAISCSYISFFWVSPPPPRPRHGFLEVNQLGNAGTGVSRMNLACAGREMLLADSPGVGPASLRCGWVRGKQSFNYLLGTWRIL